MTRLTILALLSLYVAVGCTAPGESSAEGPAEQENPPSLPDREVEPDEVFTLEQGASARIDGTMLTFSSVLEDSRCPTGVNCVWEGKAVAEVALGSESLTLEIPGFRNAEHEPEASQSAESGGHTITLLQLDPYPAQDGSHVDETSVGTFVLTDGS